MLTPKSNSARLFFGEHGHTHLLGDEPYLTGARASGVHLGDGGYEGAVHALMALDHVVREEAAGAELRDAQRQRADAGGEITLPVAVSAVRPAAAQLVGLGVHHGVDDLLGEAPVSSCMSMAPSSKRGMTSVSGVGSDKISIAAFVKRRPGCHPFTNIFDAIEISPTLHAPRFL